MAKLATMMMLLIAIQVSLMIFLGSTPANTDFWSFITNPTNWSSTPFILGFVAIAATIAAAGIFAGATFGFVTDFMIFAPAVVGIMDIGLVFATLYVTIYDFLSALFCPGVGAGLCQPATLICMFTVSPIAFYYVWTVVSWWRGRDD